MATEAANATIPDSPALAKLSEDDRRTVQDLYQNCPRLRPDFCAIMEFLEQLNKDSCAYKSLSLLLDKIRQWTGAGAHMHQEAVNISLFASAIGFVGPCVELQRQIMQEMNKDYLTELPQADEMNHVDWSRRCLSFIRSCFLNFSSTGMEFRQRLADSGVLRDLLEDARHLTYLTGEALESSEIYLKSVGIIHSCSRNPNVVPLLRQLDTVHHLAPFLEKGEKSFAKASTLMCLVFLVEATDYQQTLIELSPETLQYFLDHVDGALASGRGGYDRWATDELLDGLAALANNDFNKRLIVAAGSLKTLMAVLKHANRPEAEKKATLKLLAALANDQRNTQIFKRNGDLMNLLRNLQRDQNEAVREPSDTLMASLTREVSDSQARSSVLDEIMADCLNTLSILNMGDVEYVLQQLSVVRKGHDNAAEGISAEDLLRALADLAKEESNKREILARGGLELITQQLKAWSTDEIKQAMALLMLLTSEREYTAIMKADQALISALTDLAQAQDSNISQQAQLLLQTISPSSNISPETSDTATNTE